MSRRLRMKDELNYFLSRLIATIRNKIKSSELIYDEHAARRRYLRIIRWYLHILEVWHDDLLLDD